MAQILIKGLEVFARLGVYPEEKSLGQKFIVSAELEVDISKAVAQDDLTASVHYGEVVQSMSSFLQEHNFDLIETAADLLCRELLLQFPLVKGISLEISKPWAPVGLPLETVAVRTQLAWTSVLIALGSNMGDRARYLEIGIEKLEKLDGLRLQRVSSVFKTTPVGKLEQADFFNACAYGETILPPHSLLKKMQAIEQELGRVRKERWGPRTLDLDLLYYGNLISNDPFLTLPHPRLQNRGFVLEPAAEIAPNFVDPRYQKPIASLYQDFLLKKKEKR